MPDSSSPYAAFLAALTNAAARSVLVQRGCKRHSVDYAAFAASVAGWSEVLAQAGIGRGDVVALACGRSIEAVAVMLAANALGAAYAPIDPQAPKDVAKATAQSARAKLLVADALSRARLEGFNLPILPLETAPKSATCPPAFGAAEDVAYVLHTSGSTGAPKAVLAPNRAVLRLVQGQSFAPFGPGHTHLHAAPLAFDASVFEIYAALLHGGSLVVVPEPASLSDLAEAIAEEGVTVAWLTAGLFHLMVDHHAAALARLQCLLAGGDVLSPAHVAKLKQRAPGLHLVNGYGPTENTVFTCCHSIEAADLETAAPIPVGRPIAGGAVFILDDQGEPLADGEVGQIAAAGLGLACGYDDPELTRVRFPAAPPACAPFDRLYLTGDRGRMRPDGVVEFLGRLDRQVKVDGKRVELDGVEAALSELAGCPAAALFVNGRIVAFLADAPAAVEPLLSRLRERLPPEAVPAELRLLAALPLTSNGKVDRKRLSACVAAPLQDGPDAPQEGVRAAWARALGHARFTDHENFFDVGGTSLRLLAVHAELHAQAPQLRLVDVFAAPTVAGMQALLRRGLTEGDASADRARARGANQARFLPRRPHHDR